MVGAVRGGGLRGGTEISQQYGSIKRGDVALFMTGFQPLQAQQVVEHLVKR